MRSDGFWAADDDTVEGEPAGHKSEEPPKPPSKTGREWDEEQKKKDEADESKRDTYDDIPCTD